jgi:hypothetical protein
MAHRFGFYNQGTTHTPLGVPLWDYRSAPKSEFGLIELSPVPEQKRWIFWAFYSLFGLFLEKTENDDMGST